MVLKVVSNTEMSKDQGIYRSAFLRHDSSVVQQCNSASKLLVNEKEDSKLGTSFQTAV